MRKLLTLLAVGVVCSGLGFLRADEKGKTITIKGDALCAKCGLKDKDAKKCQNAVIVTEGRQEDHVLPREQQVLRRSPTRPGHLHGHQGRAGQGRGDGHLREEGRQARPHPDREDQEDRLNRPRAGTAARAS